MIGPDRPSDAYPLTDRPEVDAARCLLGFDLLAQFIVECAEDCINRPSGDDVEPLGVTDEIEGRFHCRLLEED